MNKTIQESGHWQVGADGLPHLTVHSAYGPLVIKSGETFLAFGENWRIVQLYEMGVLVALERSGLDGRFFTYDEVAEYLGEMVLMESYGSS